MSDRVSPIPILGTTTVYASLCQVTCDNLALNKMFGFIESFSGSYFCTVCHATSELVQVCYQEDQFERRTVDQCNEDLAGAEDQFERRTVDQCNEDLAGVEDQFERRTVDHCNEDLAGAEDQFERRTVDLCNEDLAGVEKAKQQRKNHCRGVKS